MTYKHLHRKYLMRYKLQVNTYTFVLKQHNEIQITGKHIYICTLTTSDDSMTHITSKIL